jgi:hypothetical protein
MSRSFESYISSDSSAGATTCSSTSATATASRARLVDLASHALAAMRIVVRWLFHLRLVLLLQGGL